MEGGGDGVISGVIGTELQGVWGGRMFFMCLRISLSERFMMVGVMGRRSLRQDTGDCLGTGTTVVVSKHDGKVALLREMLKTSMRTSASWSAHPFSTLRLTLCRVCLTSRFHQIVFCFKPSAEHVQHIGQGGLPHRSHSEINTSCLP